MYLTFLGLENGLSFKVTQIFTQSVKGKAMVDLLEYK